MSETFNLSRRRFLQVSALAGGALLVGFYLPPGQRAQAAEAGQATALNAWLRIDPDDTVTVMSVSEMGQGVMTSVAMLAAEELDADWSKIKAEFAPVDPAYNNPMFGMQATGGSTTVRAFWQPVREAGAAARAVLVAAAAAQWGVDAAQLRTEKSSVIHPDGQRLRYGELAAKAAQMTVPTDIKLKNPSDFKILGTPVPRLDTPAKTRGQAQFGVDVQMPGLLVAVIARCPVFGGKLKSVDDTAARKVKGVRAVVTVPSGVAVVADGFWNATQGRAALKIEWDEGELAGLNSAAIREQYKTAAESDQGVVARAEGHAASALAQAAKTLEAVYEVPYLAHACMEPMNCTAHVRADGCDIWGPTQSQGIARQVVAGITQLPPESIQIHTTFLGGGFGRRFEQDFLSEAVQVSQAVAAPVKVMWSREDDTRHDFYRPAAYNILRAGLDKDGMPVAWQQSIASSSIFSRVFPDFVKNGLDDTSVEGAADLPYAVPHIQVTYHQVEPGIPVGFWRSVGHSQNNFITETFLDELAHAGGHDPFELRRQLLAAHPRHKAVLELAAEKAGWGSPLPEGRQRGIAVAESFGSFVAEVAEVSLENGQVRVHKVVCAVDCGQIANPDTIEAQMQSAIVYGLTAALHGAITIENGRVVQGNFDDYPALRLNEMPLIEVHRVASEAAPGGAGEPGVPPLAPAVANALRLLTGKPVRSLPIRLS